MSETYKAVGKISEEKRHDLISECFKLSALEREWASVVGPVFGKRSSLASCKFLEKGALITVRTVDAASAQSIKFNAKALAKSVGCFLNISPIKIEFVVGGAKKAAVYPSAPREKSREIKVSDEEVALQLEKVRENVEDPELAEKIARIKALSAKIGASRR